MLNVWYINLIFNLGPKGALVTYLIVSGPNAGLNRVNVSSDSQRVLLVLVLNLIKLVLDEEMLVYQRVQ